MPAKKLPPSNVESGSFSGERTGVFAVLNDALRRDGLAPSGVVVGQSRLADLLDGGNAGNHGAG